MIPEPFVAQMRELLGNEFDAFIAGFSEPSRRGLRFNLLKWDESRLPAELGRLMTMPLCKEPGTPTPVPLCGEPSPLVPVPLCRELGPLTPVPWCKEGYQYPPEARPAKSLLYNAGLFYVQEPSAMSPGAILRPRPGQRVLDICAAPGGKSVQLAGYMQGKGVLVSNDISPSRSRALVKNLEMAGVANAIVLTESPHRLADRFPEYFDCILVDAPCSGEGMFRRDPDAAKAYTANKPESCGAMQQDILRHAAKMLKPGGRLVYSTCTFNPLENEGAVFAFLSAHRDFTLLPIDHAGLGVSPGRSRWVSETAYDSPANCGTTPTDNGANGVPVSALDRTARIWPHLSPGEGHFIALMAKEGGLAAVGDRRNEITRADDKGFHPARADRSPNSSRLPEEFTAFCDENLHPSIFSDANQIIHRHGSSLFLQPESMDLSGLRVARSGWLLGECTKGRFVPSQALAMGITKEMARHAIDLPEPEALRYLKGESLLPEGLGPLPGKPWVLMCHWGFPLGWARLVQGRLKNQLPTNWVIS